MVSNEELADGFIAALLAQDAKKAGEFLSEDVDYWEANLPEPLKGREAVEAHLNQNWGTFTDTSIKVINRVTSGDWQADEMEWTGKNTGELQISPDQTVPATGKQATAWVMAVGKKSGDKISDMRVYYDNLAVLAQLGLMEQPGSD
ncbi:MAG: ester cyclase [Thermoplasmata archaeon]